MIIFKYFKRLYFINVIKCKESLDVEVVNDILACREKFIILLNIVLFCRNKMDRT